MIRQGDRDYCIACASIIPARSKHNCRRKGKAMTTKKQQALAPWKRKAEFIRAIETEKFGTCPKPPTCGGKLKNMISQFVRVRGDAVIVCELRRWNKAEIKYALKTVERLGFKATWK